MQYTASASPAHPLSRNAMERLGEGRALALLLALYAAVSLFFWSGFETQYDDIGQTDPAASYVLGQGFTSGCWYAQSHDEFWAGNVPLHPFLLIGFFKLFGFSKTATQAVVTLYTCLAMVCVWFGMRRSGYVPRPELRLGAIAFFLASSNAVMMTLGGRAEPLCLLLASVAWGASTLESPGSRRTILATCGLLAPWAGLSLAVFFAFFGILALLFSWKRHWLDVAALACGGIAGSAALLLFYWKMGTLGAFLISVTPHSSIPGIPHPPIEGANYLARYDRLGGSRRPWGALDSSVLYGILLSAAACWLHARKEPRLVAFCGVMILGLPLFFLAIGVFPYYYAPYLFLPMSVVLFTLLAREAGTSPARRRVWTALLCLSTILPGSYLWRLAVQGIPSVLNNTNARVVQELRSVTRPDDVAWVDIQLWYAVKPLVKQTLSAHWAAQAKTAKERDKVTVTITRYAEANTVCLPGVWKATGETVEIPDRHRFYRFWGATYRFAVYRRVPAEESPRP